MKCAITQKKVECARNEELSYFTLISKSCWLLYNIHWSQKIFDDISLCYFEKYFLTYFARHEAARVDSVRLLALLEKHGEKYIRSI